MIQSAVSWSVLTQALGWTLVHSLWQIGLIFLVFKTFSWLFYRHNRVGYAWALAAMGAAAIWSGITFSTEYQQIADAQTAVSEVETVNLQVSPSTAILQPSTVPASPPTAYHLPFAVTDWLERQSALFGWVWCLGVAFLSLRLLGGYWLAQRLRHRGAGIPEARFADACRQWSKRLGILRPVQLLESKYITEPLTLGFWKPVVLFPAGMLLQLSPAQVEALLLHELAHVRRYDYLVNLLQLSLDVCFFYHPLFWLLSGEVRSRREYCCDDTVLRYTGDRLAYARALTELKLQPVHPQNAFTMTATGKNNFSMRILRIAGITPQRSNRSNLLFLLLLLGGMGLGALWPAPTKAAEKEGPETALQPSEDFLTKRDSVPKGSNKRTAAANAVVAPENASAGPDREPLPPAVAIELTRMNLLYIGVDNPVTITAQSDIAGGITARLKGDGKLEHVQGNEYVARVLSPGTVDIQVYAMQNGRETLIGSSTLRVKRIPDPLASENNMEASRPYAPPTYAPTGTVAIELNKMNVFYIGIDNPLRIAVDGVPADQLIVRVNGNGEISGSNNNYLARFSVPGETKIEVYRRQADGQETLLSSKIYRIKRVPDPAPRFCGMSSSSVPLDKLLRCKEVNALLQNFDYDAVCDVVGLEITILSRMEDPITYSMQSGVLSDAVMAKMATLLPGASIFMDDIRVKCPGDTAARNIGGLAFKIREGE